MRRGDTCPWRAPSCPRRRGHADPVVPGRRGRVFVRAVSCSIRPTAGTRRFRGSRRGRGTWLAWLEVRGVRDGMRRTWHGRHGHGIAMSGRV
jgi:hypothetical protein